MFYFTISILLIIGCFAESKENCDKMGVLVYEDMACSPNYKGSLACPSSFNCTNLYMSDKCSFRGQIISAGDVPKNSPVCQTGCFCEIGSKPEGPRYSCPQFGCGSWGKPPPINGCYLTNELQHCCGNTEQTCPPFRKDHATCNVDGKVYQENELFFPKDSCYRCVCKKGFKGKYEEPFCERSPCGVEIRFQLKVRKACAPVYFKDENKGDGVLCCPSEFICPDGTEEIKNSGAVSKEKQCQFGDKIVKLGEYFTKEFKHNQSNQKAKCECKIPPLLTCLRTS